MNELDEPRTWKSGLWSVEAEAYHAEHSIVSHSALEVFLASRPEYAARYVFGTIPHPEPTPPMQLGSALHCRVFEPKRYPRAYIAAQDLGDGRTKEGKAARLAFMEHAEGKFVLTAGQSECLDGMVAGLNCNPLIADWLARDGMREQAVRWVDADTGIPLKCLFDLLSGSAIINLKSAADPSPAGFAKAVHNFGYHRADAHYVEGARAALGLECEHYFVVVGSSPPHEAFVYHLRPQAQALGARQNVEALTALEHCRDTGDWTSPYDGLVNELDLPAWAYKMSEIVE